VGIKSRENFDLPYWPAHNHPNYKEVWVHPVSRWFFLMHDLAGPAVIQGKAVAAVEFIHSGGKVTVVQPDYMTGIYTAKLPAGTYHVKSGNEMAAVTFCQPEAAI